MPPFDLNILNNETKMYPLMFAIIVQSIHNVQHIQGAVNIQEPYGLAFQRATIETDFILYFIFSFPLCLSVYNHM